MSCLSHSVCCFSSPAGVLDNHYLDVRFRLAGQQTEDGHDDAGGAEAALGGVAGVETGLDRVQPRPAAPNTCPAQSHHTYSLRV